MTDARPPSPTAEPQPRAVRVLVVDDEPDVGGLLKRLIQACGTYDVKVESAPFPVAQKLAAWPPDLVFTDLLMPGWSGFHLIEQVREFDAAIPVVVVSAYSTIENAVRAIKAGAFDFLAKPFDPESVELLLTKLRRETENRRIAAELASRVRESDPYLRALVGVSRPMAQLREWVLRARAVNANVLLQGETGTGKELVARAVHGGRGPFIAVNMAAIPTDIAESELFGHRQGAFTGASTARSGLMVEAHGGTLFLDEINAATSALQAKLLRAVEEKSVRPVGGNQTVSVDFRLVCASNEDLGALVAAGRFRRDLFHRIQVLTFTLPPLRERADDIFALANEFLQRYSRAHGRHLNRFTSEVQAAFEQRGWPGNVRELENLVEQLVILAPDGATEVDARTYRGVSEMANPEHEPAQPADHLAPGPTLAVIEARYIQSVLRFTGGNKAQAARILRIDYKTLLRKLAQSGPEN